MMAPTEDRRIREGLIHRSAWKVNPPKLKFAYSALCEVASNVEFSHKLRSLREEHRGASWIGRERELQRGGAKGDERNRGVAPEQRGLRRVFREGGPTAAPGQGRGGSRLH